MENEINKQIFNKTEIINFYNNKLNQFGISHQTVGWGSKESQQLRFAVLLRNLNLENKKILDIGCGLGDLVHFIREHNTEKFSYTGIELVPDFVRLAKERFADDRTIQFIECDMEKLFLFKEPIDIVVLSGALNIRVNDNQHLMEQILTYGFNLCQECVSINFLTSYADYILDKNHHYEPEKVFSFAKTLSPKVNLIHDYPLYEFTIQIFR